MRRLPDVHLRDLRHAWCHTMPRVPGQARRGNAGQSARVTPTAAETPASAAGVAVLYESTVRTPIAPMHGEPRIASQMVSQQIAGHRVEIVDEEGDWVRARGGDGYEGWMHTGFLVRAPARAARGRAVSRCASRLAASRAQRRAGAASLPLRAILAPDEVVTAGEDHRDGCARTSGFRSSRRDRAERTGVFQRNELSLGRRHAVGRRLLRVSRRASLRCTGSNCRATRGSRRRPERMPVATWASSAPRICCSFPTGRPARHARGHRARRPSHGASRAWAAAVMRSSDWTTGAIPYVERLRERFLFARRLL